VERLLAAGYDNRSPALSSIGYSTVAALVRGEISRDAALQDIVRDTWQYARRQRTWFRHQLPVDTRSLDATLPTDELAGLVVGGWKAVSEREWR
jgi:tRNA dimethylallyltransferase